MYCPICQNPDTRVLDSRLSGQVVRRRRECLACTHRFTTLERIIYRLPVVLKRDGRRQPFIREKLLAGMRLACRKRPVPEESLDAAVDRVEQALSRRPDREVTTAEIGTLALTELRALDPVAYIRFASVYHTVGSPEDFLEVLRPLLDGGLDAAPPPEAPDEAP